MGISALPHRQVLAITGADALSFLQGMTTNDMRRVSADGGLFTAFLSPQGKFLHDAFMLRHEDGVLLESDAARLPELIARLTRYKLRAHVHFTSTVLQVVACWGEDAPLQATHIFTDPRLPTLGSRCWGETLPGGDARAYDAHRIALGVPDGARDLIYDRSLILEYGYDVLHGVAFDKGCYVGQEVTARSKHRATLRKYIHQVSASQPLPPPGTPVLLGEQMAGLLCSVEETIGLAHLDTALAAQDGLTCEGAALATRLPAWAAQSSDA